jgi:glycosyltransferase involved in cell wall biosynthesis
MRGEDLISVVLCTYNGASFIDEQMNSILLQTYTRLEIIISDDCSSDDTFEKLQTYAEKDPRIKLYRNEKNVGYNINFSKACALSTGACIAIADQDDIWEEDKIEILLSVITSSHDIVLAHCISAKFEAINDPHIKSTRFTALFSGNDIRQVFIRNPISGHNMFFKRSVLDAALPFPPAMYYDWWLAAIACCTGKIAAVNKILVWHRIHATNATGAAKPALFLYEEIQNILPALLQSKGISYRDKNFGEQLLKYYKQFPRKKFSWSLFFFLLRHTRVVFAYKKRFFPWLSYIKAAFKYSSRECPA